VRLLPPDVVKAFVKARLKTDARDARAICLAMQQPDIQAVPVKSAEQQAHRFVHRIREQLNHQHTQTANQLRSLCAEMGYLCAKGFKALHALLDRIVAGELPVPQLFHDVAVEQYDHLKALQARLDAICARVKRLAGADAKARRLQAIPGVGPMTAHAMLAGVVEPERFKDGRTLAAWLGLTPGSRSSANRTRLTGITKAGDESMRSLLVCGASSLVKAAKRVPERADPSIVALLARRPYKVVIVAIAARIARIIWAMCRSGQDYRPRYVRPARARTTGTTPAAAAA
jgi:transposase